MRNERNPMYVRDLDKKIGKKISSLSKSSKIPKWVVVESLLAKALNVESKNKLDLGKWLK